jgi:hypothetical protein
MPAPVRSMTAFVAKVRGLRKLCARVGERRFCLSLRARIGVEIVTQAALVPWTTMSTSPAASSASRKRPLETFDDRIGRIARCREELAKPYVLRRGVFKEEIGKSATDQYQRENDP